MRNKYKTMWGVWFKDGLGDEQLDLFPTESRAIEYACSECDDWKAHIEERGLTPRIEISANGRRFTVTVPHSRIYSQWYVVQANLNEKEINLAIAEGLGFHTASEQEA
jgi:hypothetical protein